MESTFDRATKVAQTQFTKMRWALGLNGLLAVVVGVLILVWPGISLYALTILFGAYTLATGVVGLMSAFSAAGGERGWLVFSSLLGIGVGVAVLVWPNISELALLYVIGAYAIALGVITLFGSYVLPFQSSADRILLALSGCVGIVFGIVMFAKPGDGAIVLLSLIAAYAIILGITELGVAIGAESLFKRAVRDSLPQAPKPQPTHS